MNEMQRKHDILTKTVAKLNDYYEANLKYNSVHDMAQQVKDFAKQLEGKANSLDVKKLIPRISKF